MLVEPGRCPGHYDMRPSDAAAVKSAKYMVVHAFQKETAEKLKKINPDIKLTVLPFGAVPLPEDYIMALKAAELVLKRFYPVREREITKNRQAAEEMIKTETGKDAALIEKIRAKKIRAVSSTFHKKMSGYFGMEVLEYFGDPESLTAAKISAIKGMKPDVIISNYPGTHDAAARAIAAATGAEVIVVSNFPENGPDKNMFINQWNKNVKEFKKLAD